MYNNSNNVTNTGRNQGGTPAYGGSSVVSRLRQNILIGGGGPGTCFVALANCVFVKMMLCMKRNQNGQLRAPRSLDPGKRYEVGDVLSMAIDRDRSESAVALSMILALLASTFCTLVACLLGSEGEDRKSVV